LLNSTVNYHKIDRLFYVQIVNYIFFFFCLWRFGQYSGHDLSFHGVSRYHSDTAHDVGVLRTSDQMLRPLPDNKYQSLQTYIHALGGIQNRNPSKRRDADPRLTPPGHRDRLLNYIPILSGNSKHIVVTGAT